MARRVAALPLVLVALMAVWARQGARLLPLIEAMAGAVIMVVALSLIGRVP